MGRTIHWVLCKENNLPFILVFNDFLSRFKEDFERKEIASFFVARLFERFIEDVSKCKYYARPKPGRNRRRVHSELKIKNFFGNTWGKTRPVLYFIWPLVLKNV